MNAFYKKFYSREVNRKAALLRDIDEEVNAFYAKFYPREINRHALDSYLKKYADKKDSLSEYVIAITPRSGSSWLTELLVSTKLAGNPDEFLNHELIEGAITFYNCLNFNDYLECLKGDQATPNGVFGIETTIDHLNLVLEGCSFDRIFPNKVKFVYLTRHDFIAQGISLYKAVETGKFHSYETEKHITEVKYNAEAIEKWIRHILNQERDWEHFFAERKIHPLRIQYEDLVENTERVVKTILAYLEIPEAETAVLPAETKHSKLSDNLNNEFYGLFSKNTAFIKKCYDFRRTSCITV